jgi:hypothetical protein
MSGTDCFVHQLLDGHRRSAANTPSRPPLSQATNGDGSETGSSYFRPKQLHSSGSHSRHLNKKQLSDMAFSIRELSKTLAHIKLRLSVQNIFILGKIHDDEVIQLTGELAEWLLQQDKHHKVYDTKNLVYVFRLTAIAMWRIH